MKSFVAFLLATFVCATSVGDGLPPSLKLWRTAVALAEAGQAIPRQAVPAQQQQGGGAAPANAWPQFRGSARQTGISSSTPPPTLKLLWTYDAGEIVESSA